MLAGLLPFGAACAERYGPEDRPVPALWPGEQTGLTRALPRRREEFAHGRACARTALRRLGRPPAAIASTRDGAPRWPPGVTGSITHCPGYVAAALTDDPRVRGLGIDAEPDLPLPADLVDDVAGGAERAAAVGIGPCWGRLLFSAKESVFKAWHPAYGDWLDFADVRVEVRADGRFAARVGPATDHPPLEGRWTRGRGLLLTAVVLAR